MRPSPTLCHRVRFTTKQVAGGFYRGTRTGAMGGHTEYGGYLIDWRKVRHFNVPDLDDFKLTPFVSKEVEAPPHELLLDDGTRRLPDLNDAKQFLRDWRDKNPQEYDHVVAFQREQLEEPQDFESPNELTEAPRGEELLVEDPAVKTKAKDTAT